MIAENVPAWCDPALSREERIVAVGLRVPYTHETAPRKCLACGMTEGKRQRSHYRGWDRYRIESASVKCSSCGLAWMYKRQSPEWYANFYASGTYRKLVSAYHGRDVMATIEQEQWPYAVRLKDKLPPLTEWTRSGRSWRILDAGGSTGRVSECIAMCKGGAADVLDPSPEHRESAFTNFIQGTLETFEPKHTYDLVLLCQTIDHLLEPRLCLEKIRGLLASDGLFFVDILDAEQEVAEKGWQQTLKIDHPFYFTDKSARLLLSATGFEIVDSWESAKNHIGYLCKGRA